MTQRIELQEFCQKINDMLNSNICVTVEFVPTIHDSLKLDVRNISSNYEEIQIKYANGLYSKKNSYGEYIDEEYKEDDNNIYSIELDEDPSASTYTFEEKISCNGNKGEIIFNLCDENEIVYYTLVFEYSTVKHDKYIKSLKWNEKRKAALKRAGNKCQLCGACEDVELQVHHNSYENLGNEKDTDLIALCKECHNGFHNGFPEGFHD